MMEEEVISQGESPACFVATVLLTLVLIRIVIAATTYVVGLYRFFDIWFYIFLINRVEQVFVDDSHHPNDKGATRQALVSRTFRKNDDAHAGETSCPICLVDFYDLEILCHGHLCRHHAFHEECISQWLSKHHSCPYCRQQMIIEEHKGESLNEIISNAFEFLKLSVYMSQAS